MTIGTTITNTGTIVVSAGAQQSLWANQFANEGLVIDDGFAAINADVTGTGRMEVSGGATLSLSGIVGSHQEIDLRAGGLLNLLDAHSMLADVASWAPGGTVDLIGTPLTGVVYAAGVLTGYDGSLTEMSFRVGGSHATSDFHAHSALGQSSITLS